MELPELLTVIDRFERQRLAERSSLIALRLMMLTLVRPSELREARWSEVDTQAGQWIIPAERMKTRVRHIVPLSSQARLLFDLQRPITGHTDLVFHTPNHRGSGELRVMSNGCLSMLLRRMGFQGRQTPKSICEQKREDQPTLFVARLLLDSNYPVPGLIRQRAFQNIRFCCKVLPRFRQDRAQ